MNLAGQIQSLVGPGTERRSVALGLAAIGGAWLVHELWIAALMLAAAFLVTRNGHPIVAWLERRSLNRPLVLAALFVSLSAAVAIVFFVAVPPLIHQVSETVRHAPGNRLRILAVLRDGVIAVPFALLAGSARWGIAIGAAALIGTSLRGIPASRVTFPRGYRPARRRVSAVVIVAVGAAALAVPQAAHGQSPPATVSSFAPVVTGDFATTYARMTAARAGVMREQLTLLHRRYDMTDRPVSGVVMSRGKPVQGSVRVRLAPGLTWDSLAALRAATIRDRDLFPAGFLPLPHPNHAEGGMVFPPFLIGEIKRQEGRDLTRFDLDFDLPAHFLPEFPAAIYLTTRADLGDVSRGRVVTIDNYFELFNGILNPKQLDGLRLLVTPFPQQQFNATDDRRSEGRSRGVACLDCHANGHTTGATHLAGDARPQAFRHRIDTPSLRGVYVQRLFGSQRALKSVEDFTEFEQRAAYFDGDPLQAAKKGVNVLDRGSQVHAMAEFQALLDFPPAPGLGVDGKLDPELFKPADPEMRGQSLFFGKATCGTCHPAPYYTDNLSHNLRVERFFAPRMINGRMASADGPIKTFSLRGIKESPPYLHDGRLLTLDDTVEFFNLILALKLTTGEKRDLVAFLRSL